MTWIIKALSKKHHKKDFDCHEPALTEYLQKYALQHANRNLNKSYVACHIDTPEHIAGFYSLSTGSIMPEQLPNTAKAGIKHAIPIAYLTRLAVDYREQGKDLGAFLLINALERCLKISQEVGLFGVVVDAKNDTAKSFYSQYGFEPLSSNELSLILLTKDISFLARKN
ncbi:acetyltransferase [Beggiatoa alba B18LD]|uniref:Acetyltransferase n=1 Tax=Beggiatoa alba B18LD TaxID=395493 RepID=I3CE21_9GAMM|nr:GNAT family N-acetyltransferase [Beggiatoa alba]EIJ41864.1 acetyltransferase [Beggiatoa alba B18LD]